MGFQSSPHSSLGFCNMLILLLYKTSEMPDIEKEVKRLFRMDNEAIDVKWEVVIEEERPDDPNTAEKQVLHLANLWCINKVVLENLF